MRTFLFALSLCSLISCQTEGELVQPEKKTEKIEKKPMTNCTYLVKDAKPHWTAYKYTKKAAVGGTFNTYKLSGMEESKPAATIAAALKGLSIDIDAASVESKNPARNKTIADNYFGKFAPASSIKASILSSSGDDGAKAILFTAKGAMSCPYWRIWDGLFHR